MSNPVLYSDSSMSIEFRNYQNGHAMSLHKHDYLSISLLLKGSLIEESQKNSIQPYSGFVSIKPEGLYHSDVFVNDCSFLSLKVFDANYYKLNFNDWQWIPPSAAIRYLIGIAQQANKKEAVRNFAQFLNSVRNSQSSPIPVWLMHVHTIICRHYKERLMIKDIASEVGKHPFHVAKMFEKYYGLDIVTYKHNLRLHNALSDAVNKKNNLTQLAHHYGFSDQSHFCREFKKSISLSPKKALSLFDV